MHITISDTIDTAHAVQEVARCACVERWTRERADAWWLNLNIEAAPRSIEALTVKAVANAPHQPVVSQADLFTRYQVPNANGAVV
jgi:hypothetical protein